MKFFTISIATLLSLLLAHRVVAQTLDIYFIDVEGGQSTLVVTPGGESLLIDAGFAGDGSPSAQPGNPANARDANRILAAARDAGIKQIDYLLITHFHSDHIGGVPELSQLLPIKHFVDHGIVLPEAEQKVPGTVAAYKAYLAVRAKGTPSEPKPGDHLPFKGIDVTVVSAAASTLTRSLARSLAGAGSTNTTCSATGLPAGEPTENSRSTGIVLTFGKFRFLDLGDLSGPPLLALACPADLIGPVDAYLVAHHGGADAAEPATFAAFRPRVAIMNNGRKKGGALATYELLHRIEHLDTWQLHKSDAAGANNFDDRQIANLGESTAHWIKLSARDDGSFKVSNGRTGESKSYAKR